jgi:hypothetical protein
MAWVRPDAAEAEVLSWPERLRRFQGSRAEFHIGLARQLLRPPQRRRSQPFTAPTRRVKPTPRTVWISWGKPLRSILRRR